MEDGALKKFIVGFLSGVLLSLVAGVFARSETINWDTQPTNRELAKTIDWYALTTNREFREAVSLVVESCEVEDSELVC